MKTIVSICIVCLSLWGAHAIAKPPLPIPNNTPEQPLNRIVAIVNSDIITQTELNQALRGAEQQLSQNGMPPPSKTALEKQVLNQLIFMKIQLQIAQKNHITVSEEEVDAAIGRLAAQNKISVPTLKEALAKEGLSYPYFRNKIKQQLIIAKLQQQAITPTIKITKEDVSAYRQKMASASDAMEYHVVNLLMPVASTATPTEVQQTKATAEALLKKLRAGASFEAAMEQYPGSGDLDWRMLDDLPALFAAQVQKMKTGEIAGPLKAPNGFHLIKLLGKRNKSSQLTDDQIQNIIFQEKFQTALKQWLLELRQAAYVHINVESLKE